MPEWFHITFELAHGTPADYEAVYALVHAEGGYRYRLQADGSWGRLPGTAVALPVAVSNPEVARIAFELKLAHLDMVASAIVVARGEVALTMQRVDFCGSAIVCSRHGRGVGRSRRRENPSCVTSILPVPIQ